MLPVAGGCAGVVLDVFAPRNAPELRRILSDDGALLVVTPTPAHLRELRPGVGLLEVDPEKDRRTEATLEPHFRRASTRELEWTMSLPRADALALVTMGPSARHLDAAALAGEIEALPDEVAVTASVRVAVWRPRGGSVPRASP
jgi:23S rRNA (guanine745-N1)-methyltransferase